MGCRYGRVVSPLPLGGGGTGSFPWANSGIWGLIKDALCCILSNHKWDFEDRRSSFIYPFFDRFAPFSIIFAMLSLGLVSCTEQRLLLCSFHLSYLSIKLSLSCKWVFLFPRGSWCINFFFALLSLRFSVSVKLNSHYCHGLMSTATSGYCI